MKTSFQKAQSICQTLHSAGYTAFLAGGCVRDYLLKIVPKDYDIATSATPEDVAELFPHCIPVGAAFGVQIVMLDEEQFEVATFRSDGDYSDGRRPDSVTFTSPEEDALRRDFTVNALFMDPETKEIIDYVGGREDLSKRCIRAVGDPVQRFTEDHLRLMRAIRFASQLDFEIETDTYAAISECAPLLEHISPERIRNELERILTQPRAPIAMQRLYDTGLLKVFLPELCDAVGCEQPPQFHPEGDVFTHTLLVLAPMESPTFTLAMGALLHDIGKPPTQTFEDRIRFNFHEKVGAEMTRVICRRLKLSNDDSDRITWLVSQHMRVAACQKMRESKRKRLVREEGFEELLELMRLDSLGCHRDLSNYDWLKNYAETIPEEVARPKLLISGKDLIDLGYTPGPRFSEILLAIEDLQLDEQLKTRDEAISHLQEHWPPAPPSGK